VQIRTVHGIGYLLARTTATAAAVLVLLCGMAGVDPLRMERAGNGGEEPAQTAGVAQRSLG
jgi:hypothetical protein